MKVNVGDTVGNYGKVTRISDCYVWFGDKKFLREKLENTDNLNVIFKESPDASIDWTDPVVVDKYYLTFDQWAGVIRMGDSKSRQILEVKNNKILFEGEYYLPYYSHHIGLPEKKFLEDCYIFGYCIKMHNSFYSHQNPNTVNVFYTEQLLSDEDYKYGIEKEKNYERYLNKEESYGVLDYLRTLNIYKMNSRDLDLFKENFLSLLDEKIFPYTVNKVTFSRGLSFGKIEIGVSHRNRSGTLKIDNGYNGPSPFQNDYSVHLVCEPNFTNEHGTYTRCERGELSWDKAMLEKLSVRIVKAWDRAIEQNFRIYG